MFSGSRSYQQPFSRPTQSFHASGIPSSLKDVNEIPRKQLIESLARLMAEHTHLMQHHIQTAREGFKLGADEVHQRVQRIPGFTTVESLDSIPDVDAFVQIALYRRGYPVNPTTADDHIKGIALSHAILESLVRWMNDEDFELGLAIDRRSTEIWDEMANRPTPLPGASLLDVPRVNPRPLAPGQFCPIRSPGALYDKTFRTADGLVFKVVGCTGMPTGETEFKLRYQTKEVDVEQEELQSMLETCLYYPVS